MIDSDLLRHVWNGAKLLGTGSGSTKERLDKAASEFAVALLQPECWPKDLLERALELDNKLCSKGTFSDTIEQLQQREVLELAMELMDLAFDVYAEVRIDMRENAL